jgi:hypothetical protein
MKCITTWQRVTRVGTGLILPLLGFCVTIPLRAQQPPRVDEQRVVRMTLTPTPTTRPALAHPLLPSALEQTPGNAATLYLLATIPIKETPPNFDFLNEWLQKPRKPNDDDLFYRLNTSGHAHALDHAAAGARREFCNWDLTLKTEGFRTRLPHLSPLSDIAYLNAVRARAHAANGDHAAALRDLQTNFALARHLNDESTLVQGLVSARIVRITSDAMEEFVQSPGAPNLYWSLLQLPRPYIDVARVLDYERFALQFSFPPLKNPDTLTREHFQEMLRSLGHFYDEPSDKLELTLGLIHAYPRAKDHLVTSRGRPREQVEAMPAHQVLAHYLIDLHVELCDEGGKWYPLPYWQSRQALLNLDEQHKRNAGDQGLRFVTAFVPALHRARLQFAEADRRLAALQCVEALRAHAAHNDGKLPASLADVRETPIPLDPITGQPFSYRLDGQVAVIDCPAVPGEQNRTGFKYEITVAR